MKILVPLNDMSYFEEYVEAGAEEFYLGFYDCNWNKYFGDYADINRMSPFGALANKYSFEELLAIIKTIKKSRKKVFVTMNANVYNQKQINFIKDNYFEHLIKAETDGVIASDVNLIKAISKTEMLPVASTMCGIYNSDIVQLYSDLGVRRMILPRDLSLEEIKLITSGFSDIQFEVFFMRNGCAFSDGYCLGQHGERGSLCQFIRNHPRRIITSYQKFTDVHACDTNDYIYNSFFHRETCGLCALYKLKEANVKALKIVGRADSVRAICSDIRLTKKNLEILENSFSEEEFLDNMVFPDDLHRKCMLGLSCYYPESRFD